MSQEKKIDAVIEKAVPVPNMNFREWQRLKRDAQREPLPEETKAYIANLKKPLPEKTGNIQLSLREMFDVIRRRGEIYINLGNTGEKKPFLIDAENGPVYKALILYFINDPEFEKIGERFSLKKGIMLRGNVGRGKTLMLKLFSHINASRSAIIHTIDDLKQYGWGDGLMFQSDYHLNHFVSCKQIEREFSKRGYEAVEEFTRSEYSNAGRHSKKRIFCFDDMGAENIPASYFGAKANVMEDVLMDRYELFVEHGLKTHLTTNVMNAEEMELKYGARIRSRLREMFNIIDLEGPDRRK